MAGLPNQVLGKVAAFILSPAWLVTSFMLRVCLCAQRGSTRGKQKEHQPIAMEIHLERLRHSSQLLYPLSFSLDDLTLSPCTTILEYASRRFIQFEKKICIAHEGPQDNTVQTWKSLPYHLGHLPRQPYLKKQNSKTLLGEILPCHVP